MSGTIMPAPWFTALDDNGVTVIGAKLYTYFAGTSVPQYTYADAELQVPNPNPVICDGGGRATVYLAASSYKFILKDANDVTIRTQDDIAANAAFSADLDIAGLAGENLFAGAVAYLSVGAETPPRTAGHWYLADATQAVTSTGAEFISIVQGAVTTNNVGAFRLQGRTFMPSPPSPLTIGATYYVATTPGNITTVPPTFARVVGIADNLNTLVTASGFGGGIVVSGDQNITGNISVGGGAVIGGPTTIGGQLSVNSDIVLTGDYCIRRNTVDGADTGGLILSGGGGPFGSPHDRTRGAFIALYGNEQGAGVAGTLTLGAGDVNPGNINFALGGPTLAGVMFHSTGFAWGGLTDPGPGSISVLHALYVNRPNNVGLPITGHLSVKAAASAGVDGIQVQLDTDAVVGARFATFFNSTGTPQGSISQTNATTVAFNTSSDERLKVDLGIPLETRVLPHLIVHDFQWKEDGTVGRGLFAQEAATVLPAAVTPGCDGPVVDEPWMVDYSKVVPDLIVGWQAHEQRIISLLERLERLESPHDGKTP